MWAGSLCARRGRFRFEEVRAEMEIQEPRSYVRGISGLRFDLRTWMDQRKTTMPQRFSKLIFYELDEAEGETGTEEKEGLRRVKSAKEIPEYSWMLPDNLKWFEKNGFEVMRTDEEEIVMKHHKSGLEIIEKREQIKIELRAPTPPPA